MPEPPTQSIREAAAFLGVSPHTLRYYDRDGLLTVPRDPTGERRYGAQELGFLKFLIYLRGTGMGMAGLREYAALAREGEGTVEARRQLLIRHEAQVAAQLNDMHRALDAIREKIARYDRLNDQSASAQGHGLTHLDPSPASVPALPQGI
ncbi:MerR family transcriptional regulator [Deinococcus sp. KSM4-11]|uniref:MerR family transcriptional regulator n=1 Tax=Deinococcus sp. KSM4-11 TaxID=2568654 RepID=UPI0010A41A75|nr:MerR family transcriptional regulator [Deinococcus sp. KSM4-11]THF88507.1 MerR family transcriptional regulator [Deinococcus sp. KSM4-11]